MRHIILLIFLCTSIARAESGYDHTPHYSPDGKWIIRNFGETHDDFYFEISARNGQVVYSSHNSSLGEARAEQIEWSHDSHFVLFCVRPFNFYSTCIFSTADPKLESLSAKEGESWTIPIRWISSRSFTVEVSGIHGHKVPMDSWHYRETIRIREQPLSLNRIYTGPKILNDTWTIPHDP